MDPLSLNNPYVAHTALSAAATAIASYHDAYGIPSISLTQELPQPPLPPPPPRHPPAATLQLQPALSSSMRYVERPHRRHHATATLQRLERARLLATRSAATLKLAQMEERVSMLRIASERAAAVAAAAAKIEEEERMWTMMGRNRGGVGGLVLLQRQQRRTCLYGPIGASPFGMEDANASSAVAPLSGPGWHDGEVGETETTTTSLRLKEAEEQVAFLRGRRRNGEIDKIDPVKSLDSFQLLAAGAEMQKRSDDDAGKSAGIVSEDFATGRPESIETRMGGGGEGGGSATTRRRTVDSGRGEASVKVRLSVKLTKTGKIRKPHKKKPIDMPRRALSAYNLFFAEERRRIIGDSTRLTDEDSTSALGGGGSEGENEGGTKADDKNGGTVLCADMTRTIARARLHRKSHGLGFSDLTKIIAARWRKVSPERLQRYNRLAAEDARRHKKAMEEYYTRQREAVASAAAASDERTDLSEEEMPDNDKETAV